MRRGRKPQKIPEHTLRLNNRYRVPLRMQAKELGTSLSTLILWRRELRLKWIPVLAHLTREKIEEARVRGISRSAYAKELGVALRTLDQRFHELKTYLGSRGRPGTRNRIAFAVCAHDNHHLSFEQIGRAFGISRQGAWHLYRLGKKEK